MQDLKMLEKEMIGALKEMFNTKDPVKRKELSNKADSFAQKILDGVKDRHGS